VLEVMGGLSSPSSAAEAVGMSLPRYYALEKKALEGLVAACSPGGRRGRQASPAREAEQLRERVKGLEREAARNLALLRAAQRAAGLAAPSPKSSKGSEKDAPSPRRRRRKPVVRALVVAESLRGVPLDTSQSESPPSAAQNNAI
jgi:hypothetical protein